MSNEPEDPGAYGPTAVVPFEEPEAQAKPVPATSVLRLPMGRKGPQLLTIDDALKYATACHRSGLLPEHIKTPQQAYVIMDNGRELGLGPWASWKLIYITRQGRIAIMSKGALAVVQACAAYEGYTERIEYEGTEEMQAVAVAKRKGRTPTEKRFSLADAKAADLISRKKNRRGEEYDGPWQSFVKDMLLARARDRALSVAFAAELAGIEPETIAEDADMLDAKAAGGQVTKVGAPREPENGALEAQAPKTLPAPKPDPLLAFVLKGAAPPVATAGLIEKGIEKAVAHIAKAQMDAAYVAQPAPLQQQIDESVDEALVPPKKAKTKAEPKRFKVGDIMHGTRRVLEVDEDGRPTVVEKLSAEELAQLSNQAKPTLEAQAAAAAPQTIEVEATLVGPDGTATFFGWQNAQAERRATRPPPEGSASAQSSKRCPREHCGAPLNLLGDCDACGWPNTQYK